MRKRKFWNAIRDKGYYIALVLCAIAIGVSAFLYYRTDDGDSPNLPASVQDPDGSTPSTPTTPGQDATDPSGTQATDPAKPTKITMPVDWETVMEYAMDCLSYNPTTRDWRVHNGIDIAAPEDAPVYAAADGTVYTVFEDETMGTTVVLRHAEGYTTRYSSLAKEVSVTPGQMVLSGDQIGTVGQTAMLETAIGDHVHFSVTCNGDPMDPQEFLSLGTE